MNDGIHGKIARVGLGFGTGRHTANIRYHRRNVSQCETRVQSANTRISRRKISTCQISESVYEPKDKEPLPFKIPKDSVMCQMIYKFVASEFMPKRDN